MKYFICFLFIIIPYFFYGQYWFNIDSISKFKQCKEYSYDETRNDFICLRKHLIERDSVNNILRYISLLNKDSKNNWDTIFIGEKKFKYNNLIYEKRYFRTKNKWKQGGKYLSEDSTGFSVKDIIINDSIKKWDITITTFSYKDKWFKNIEKITTENDLYSNVRKNVIKKNKLIKSRFKYYYKTKYHFFPNHDGTIKYKYDSKGRQIEICYSRKYKCLMSYLGDSIIISEELRKINLDKWHRNSIDSSFMRNGNIIRKARYRKSKKDDKNFELSGITKYIFDDQNRIMEELIYSKDFLKRKKLNNESENNELKLKHKNIYEY